MNLLGIVVGEEAFIGVSVDVEPQVGAEDEFWRLV
jgi:hypothetical protein